MLRKSRRQGVAEERARLNALAAIIAELDDTCLLHRAGLIALTLAKLGAKRILAAGGVATDEGFCALKELDRTLVALNASPGGSADLLAGVLFLDRIESNLV
jgi:triphosphoribosyl-dephospho-CoA synthase